MLYYDLGKDITAFSTTRDGGFSSGSYASMNINRYCGDSPVDIDRNVNALCKQLEVKAENIIMPHQTHGIEVRQIGADFLMLDDEIRKMILEGVDSLITDVKDACIGVSTADCIPIILYDPEHRAVAAVHAGWRGTVGRIVQKTVAVMRPTFGTRPEKLSAVIGPGISEDAFEVGDEVYQAFAEAAFNMESISRRTDKWHIDLPECNRQQLLETGISPDNIASAGICTYNNSERFFSARKLGTASGRIFTGVVLR